jgi:hypothetical protein
MRGCRRAAFTIERLDAMYLLVTTPRFILGCDVASGKVDVLSTGGRYYGLTWNLTGEELAITHASYEGALDDLGDYAMADVGYVTVGGRRSWAFLNAPHQALWIDDSHVLVMNTGRNAVASLDTRNMSVRQARYETAIWDVHDKTGALGSHYNSAYFDGSSVYFVAHNFSREAFIVKAHWPSLELVERYPIANATGVHNLWIDDRGRWIVCDSNAGGLVDARDGSHLWNCRGEGFTRGLAASEDLIFVGNSQVANRENRETNESGIWVLDRQTFALRDFLLLGSFGGVHEVRIADEPDACHHRMPLRSTALSIFGDWREERRRQVLAVAGTRLPDEASWQARFGRIASRDGAFISSKDVISLMTHQATATTRDSKVCARLHVISWNTAHHAALVTRYSGPGDKRMYAAIFQADANHRIVASLWLHDDDWRCLASDVLDWTVAGNGEGPGGGPLVCLETRGPELTVSVDGKSVLQLNDASLSDGLNGIRIFGDTIGLSDFQVVC